MTTHALGLEHCTSFANQEGSLAHLWLGEDRREGWLLFHMDDVYLPHISLFFVCV